MIQAIAEPILEHISKLETSIDSQSMSAIPQLKLILDGVPRNIKIGEFELDEPFIEELETYISDQMQWRFPPTKQH